MNQRSAHRAHQAGFSILEAVVTLVFFALLGVMALPVFSEMMSAFELHGASRQLFAEMQQARMVAIMENTRCRARMVNAELKFESFDATKAEWVSMPEQDLDTNDTDGLTLAASGDIITFAPNGSAPHAGTITLTDAEGNSRVISVTGAGAIRID